MLWLHRQPLILSSLFIILFMVGIMWSMSRFIQTYSDVDVSFRIIRQTNLVKFALLDAETGQRGYIITGDERFLEPYINARSSIDQELNGLNDLRELRELETININNIITLAHDKLNELAKVIDLRNQNDGFNVAIQEVKAYEGKQVMDDIRHFVSNVDSTETKNIYNYRIKLRQLGIVVFICTFGITVCTGLFAFVLGETYQRK